MEKAELLEIMEKFNQSGLAELRYRSGEHELVLRRYAPLAVPPAAIPSMPPPPMSAPPPGAPAPTPAEPQATPATSAAAAETVRITSPIVGTFYRSPAPDAPPFVEEGQEVKKGQVLCILEAMKNMNQLEAEFDCVIVKILVDNGTLVEYGTPLFEVRKK